MTILAIDQGTTSTRALLVSAAGVVPLAAFAHRQHYPAPGHVEHDPAELLSHVRACLAAAAGIADLTAVALTHQGESCLAWDSRSGEALTPVIVWQDARTSALTERLRADGAEAEVMARAGLPLDPYFSASKLGWIMARLPQAAARLAQGRLSLGTTDAWFRWHLTGRAATDTASASRTSLMALDSLAWDATLCAVFGVPLAALPPIGPSAGELGHVRVGTRDLPLAACIVDQQAALFGHGARHPGQSKITFGTGAFALALAGPDRPPASCGVLPTVAWTTAGATTLALEGGVYAAAAAVNWAQGLGLFTDRAQISSFDGPPAIARGLAFVPALAGLACPHWDRGARGAWFGLALDTTPLGMAQAVLEGVAFRAAEVIAAMDRATPVAGPVGIDGGMTGNPWFCQFLADTLGRAVAVSAEPELTALGAAGLAAAALGLPLPPAPGARLLTPREQPPDWAARFAAARSAVQGYARA